MAEDYLSIRRQLTLSIQLVDSRHEPTKLDIQLYEWLKFHGKKCLIVATKADKLSSNKLNKSLNRIAELMPDGKLLAYSSATGKGKAAVWAAIEDSV